MRPSIRRSPAPALRVAGVLCALACAVSPAHALWSASILRNGDAEADAPSATGHEIVPGITGWVRSGNATVVSWNETSGFPALADPGPGERGASFFSGGPSNARSELHQSLDLAHVAFMLESGTCGFRLAAYLGGFEGQGDNAQLRVIFRDAGGAALDSATLGPVTTAERGSVTGMLRREREGVVPAATRRADLRLLCLRVNGTYNDGYADSITFALDVPTLDASAAGRSPRLTLAPVAPDPVRGTARFSFTLPEAAEVEMDVLDVQGRPVAELHRGPRGAGEHAIAWPRDAATPPGVYFARLRAAGASVVRRFVVID